MVSSCIYSLCHISVTGRVSRQYRAPLATELSVIASPCRFMSNYLTTRLARGKRCQWVRGPFSLVPTRRRSVPAGLSAEEEKKAKKKAKKAQQKQEEQKKGTDEPLCDNVHHSFLVAAAATSTNEDKGLDLAPQKDDDPDGTKLLTSPEPLERAWKLLSPLVRLSISNIDLWVTVYDVAVRRGG